MSSSPPKSLRLVLGMMLAEILSMSGFSIFAATLVEFSRLWSLTPTHAGWISSAYYAGYVLAVPVLVGLTDRFDSKKIYIIGSLIGVGSGVGFAFFAEGFGSALIFRLIAGVSLAGTYMPGLRMLSERLTGEMRLRAVPYYTASFGVGVSLSFLLTGWIEQVSDWRTAFLVSGACSGAAILLVMVASAGIPRTAVPPADAPTRHPLDLRPVFTNRDALGYILAYCGHCWELFALRAWLAAFLLFAWTRSHTEDPGAVLTHWSTLIVLIGVPASIIGAEVATQRGRKKLILWITAASVVLGAASALAGSISFWAAVIVLFAYNFAATADSGAITTGALAAARAGEEGATLAVHSIIGFLGGVIGPLIVGLGLELGGGIAKQHAWDFAFLFMVAGSALAAAAIALVRSQRSR
ncbi:MAG TPA: MFS transporter [Nitrospirota bacterium]|nr:MFS transporter [Nitrospirota bacterium]